MTDATKTEDHQVTIVVNGRPKTVAKGELTFRDVVLLAFPDAVFDEKTEYTVAYSKGADHKPKGTMVEGDTIKVKEGEVFNVTPTDRS